MMRLILSALAALLPAAASAQGRMTHDVACYPTEVVATVLGADYQEWPLARGRAADGSVIVQMWANVETGTWTVVSVRGDGVSCLLASGQDFQILAPPPPGDPA